MPEKAMDEDTERQGVAIKHEGFCLKGLRGDQDGRLTNLLG